MDGQQEQQQEQQSQQEQSQEQQEQPSSEQAAQASQAEAQQKSALPEGVKLAEPTPADITTLESAPALEKIKKYGETSVERFIRKAQSDPIFGRLVLRDLLGLEPEHVYVAHKTSGASQENNPTETHNPDAPAAE